MWVVEVLAWASFAAYFELKQGFTLIELLGVAIIIIVLSLMALPVYWEVTDRARQARSAEELRVIEQAVERHKAETGFYPASLSKLLEAGYLKSMTFESAWRGEGLGRYYFYAVDHAENPRAFALGDPGLRPTCDSARLYPDASTSYLPCGKAPSAAWLFGPGGDLLDQYGAPLAKSSLRGWRPSDLKTE